MVDRVLDKLWEVTLPLAGRCPVCAFYKGVAIGLLVGALVIISLL